MTAEQLDIGDLESFYDERYEGDYMAWHGDLEVWRTLDALSSARLPERPDVVDYGCGRGAWVPVLNTAFPDARIVGVEISPRAVEEAQATYPQHDFRAFDGGQAPVESESAGLVFSYHVIEHVLDLDETIGDMARIARSGGYVCAICPCGNEGSMEELATRLVDGGSELSATGERRFFYEDPGHLRRLTSAALSERFARHGCRLVQQSYSRHLAALDYLTGQPHVVTSLFDPSRATTRSGAVRLSALRAGFLAVSVFKTARYTPRDRLLEKLRGGSPKQRTAAAASLVVRPLVGPVLNVVEQRLPRREWRRSAHEPRGGAAQFLLFRKD